MIWDEVQVSVLFKSSPDDFHVQLGLRTTAPSAVDGKIKGLRKTWDRMSALPTNATADLKVFNTLALKVKIYPWGGGDTYKLQLFVLKPNYGVTWTKM